MKKKIDLKEAARQQQERYENMPGAKIVPYNPGNEREREILPDGSVYVDYNYGDATYSDLHFTITKPNKEELLSTGSWEKMKPVYEAMKAGKTAKQIEDNWRKQAAEAEKDKKIKAEICHLEEEVNMLKNLLERAENRLGEVKSHLA